jgi:hypothetical protein
MPGGMYLTGVKEQEEMENCSLAIIMQNQKKKSI